MAGILLREVLAHKDVTQVSAAVGTLNFGPHTVRVRQPPNRTWNFLVKAWPAAVRLKLAFRTVQRSAAAFADVGARVPEGKVFADEGHLGAFVDDNPLFFGS